MTDPKGKEKDVKPVNTKRKLVTLDELKKQSRLVADIPISERSTGVYGPMLDEYLEKIRGGEALEVSLPVANLKVCKAITAGLYDASKRRGLKTRQSGGKIYVFQPTHKVG